PRMTTSRAVIFAATWPLRPTVTRLPGRLTVPSTLPSTSNDSEPEISPLTNRPFPMVACSALTGAAWVRAGSVAGIGVAGRGGSGVRLGLGDPVWLGFHIALKVVPFLSLGTGGWPRQRPEAEPKENINSAGHPAPRQSCFPGGYE